MITYIDNRTDLPTPSWLTQPGVYIDALGEFWVESVRELIRERGSNLPENLQFGYVLDAELEADRRGNIFMINPVKLSEPGLGGYGKERKQTPPSFKKRWRMDRDRNTIKSLAHQLIYRRAQ